MLKTPLCEHLGIEYPIFSAGIGFLATAELVSAVSNAGGCGVIGTAGAPLSYVNDTIRHTRSLTDKPFGINILLARLREGVVESCIETGVPLLVFFWGDPAPYVERAHRQGSKVFVQVGGVDEAKAAADAGVDGIIAQGLEAGGHLRGAVPLAKLLPEMLDAVSPTPVIASGGIGDGRGIAEAIRMGAQGVSLGTRFVCTEEAHGDRAYKERIVQSMASDTVYTTLFDIGFPDAPHRVLRNKAVDEWEAAGKPPNGRRPGEGEVIGTAQRAGETLTLLRYSSPSYPAGDFSGDIDYASLLAGESCQVVNDIKPAATVVRDLVREAEATFAGSD